MLNVAYLKKHLKIEHITADDTYLADLEAAAVSAVEEYEGTHYGTAGEITHYLPGSGTTDLWLPEAPNGTDLAGEDPGVSIIVHEAAYPGDDLTELVAADDDGYLVRGSKLVRKGGYLWSRGYEYTVRYNRGGLPGTAPERVQQAVRMLVARWYSHRTGISEVGSIKPDDEVGRLLKRRAPRVG